jgi:ABC transport system ATP-binding/permease protein
MTNTSSYATVLKAFPYLVLRQGQEVLQFSLNQDLHRLGRDADWADFVVPVIGWDVISRRHAMIKRKNQHYWLYDGDEAGTLSSNGLLLDRRRIQAEGCLLTEALLIEIGQDPHTQVVLSYVDPAAASVAVPHQHLRLNLRSCQTFPVVLGRTDEQRYEVMHLDAPMVSRHHAEIHQDAQGNYILKDTSTNGTYINNQRVDKPTLLKNGDVIRISPFTLVLRDQVLELFDRGKQIRIDAHGLTRRVKNKQNETTILNNVSLAIEPGQFVALVGGSGAGKSTLMKTLLGINPTTSGTVYLNGDDLRKHFSVYQSQIGYVPQDDIMHRELTVEEVLSYACKMRLPADISVKQEISKVLNQVKLSHVKDTLVEKLSGGQRKRVSIAVELLADPWLFFLDEPTSGLDPGLDKEIMLLLRELASQGRTVVLVTHATTNIKDCDRIAFMGRGGSLCYFGLPKECMDFFEIASADLKDFADVYRQLEGDTEAAARRQVNEWSQKFAASPWYETYIKSVLSNGNQMVQAPAQAKIEKPKTSSVRQLIFLSQRSAQLLWRDRQSLILSLLTAPIGIALIVLPLGDQSPLAKLSPLDPTQAPLALRVLFVFTCACLWVGLSGSVQEIVKESSIYARERLVNLRLWPYIGSKILILGGLAALQTLLIATTVLIGFKSPTPPLLNWFTGLTITTFLTLFSSFSLGLMISSFTRNENQANSMLPLVLLPQIIFSGVLFELDGLPSKLSWLMISRWSIGAYGALVDVNGMVPESVPSPTELEFPTLFEPSSVYDATWQNIQLNWLLLCVHAGVYILVSLWRQKQKDVV